MKSVTKNEYTFVIKNSKFISRVHKIESEQEINNYLEQAKKDYPNATHYCYAYILDTIKKESDDGEPSKTAGLPILQVLEKNELNYVLCIVIRYFGKIKLGANGLIRAYTKAATNCLENHIINLTKGYLINISFPYSYSKKIDYLLLNSKIIKKDFEKEVYYEVEVEKDIIDLLKSNNNEIKINIIKEVFIESNK